jgi:hypothetical protein
VVAIGWDEENDASVAATVDSNLRSRVVPLVAQSALARQEFAPALACRWHREMLHGVVVTPPQAAGGLRHPSWCRTEVEVGGFLGVPTALVANEVVAFKAAFQGRIQDLDDRLASGHPPPTETDIRDVLLVAAELHGEWVRIHPFVNGNGRTARAWANWATIRYGLLPLLPMRPRPSLGQALHQGHPMDQYAKASMMSLAQGYHRVMYAAIRKAYREAYAP